MDYFVKSLNSWQVSLIDNLDKVFESSEKVFEFSEKNIVRKAVSYELSSERNYADLENPFDVFFVFDGIFSL